MSRFTAAPTPSSKIRHIVKNGTTPVTKGTPVYITTASGTNMIIGPASNASEATSSKTIGIVEQNLGANEFGFVITEGLITNINTQGSDEGDAVWLGVDGAKIYGLENKPYAPAHLVYLGVVTRSNQNTGEMFVHIQNGFEIKELHDVVATAPQLGDTLIYNDVSGLWESGSIKDEVGISYVDGIPATQTSTGEVGQIAIDGVNGVLYICTQPNVWQKVSLNSANFSNPGGFV